MSAGRFLPPRPPASPLPGDLPPEPSDHSTSPRKPSQTPAFPQLHCPFSPNKTSLHTEGWAQGQHGHLLIPVATEGTGGCPLSARGRAARVEAASPPQPRPRGGCTTPPRLQGLGVQITRGRAALHNEPGAQEMWTGLWSPGLTQPPRTSGHTILQGPSSPPPRTRAPAPFTPLITAEPTSLGGSPQLPPPCVSTHTQADGELLQPRESGCPGRPDPAPPGWATCGSQCHL